ncbi:Uncharacterized protein APZ42_000527, partial [Daphnia magna]
TPVPENHIEANVSTTILPDLDNIVVIFEEDPLATVENVNISLDVQNGETFDLRGVLEEDSNRNPVEIMRPYPKAGPRKGSSTGRKRSTAILTDTPVKAQLEKEKMATDAKKNKLGKVRRKLNPTPVKKTARKSRRANQENNNPTIPVQNLPRPSSSAQNLPRPSSSA